MSGKVLSLVLAVVCLSGPAVAAAEPASAGNVRITIAVGKLAESRKTEVSTVQVVITLGDTAGFSVGNRVPLPATAKNAEGEPQVATSYTYQNVGLSGTIETRDAGERKIFLRGNIETSLLRDSEGQAGSSPGAPPTVGTFSEKLSVVVPYGKPIRVAEVSEPGRGSFYIDVRADLLD